MRQELIWALHREVGGLLITRPPRSQAHFRSVRVATSGEPLRLADPDAIILPGRGRGEVTATSIVDVAADEPVVLAYTCADLYMTAMGRAVFGVEIARRLLGLAHVTSFLCYRRDNAVLRGVDGGAAARWLPTRLIRVSVLRSGPRYRGVGLWARPTARGPATTPLTAPTGTRVRSSWPSSGLAAVKAAPPTLRPPRPQPGRRARPPGCAGRWSVQPLGRATAWPSRPLLGGAPTSSIRAPMAQVPLFPSVCHRPCAVLAALAILANGSGHLMGAAALPRAATAPAGAGRPRSGWRTARRHRPMARFLPDPAPARPAPTCGPTSHRSPGSTFLPGGPGTGWRQARRGMTPAKPALGLVPARLSVLSWTSGAFRGRGITVRS
jgi:hypothetical protein